MAKPGVRFPKKPKAPHHKGSYAADAKRVRDAANADPRTRCWRCGHTLGQCQPHRTGRPATWTAGHLNDGETGGLLLPECSTCNVRAGARLGEQRAHGTPTLNTSRTW